jgi:hypothetical protein
MECQAAIASLEDRIRPLQRQLEQEKHKLESIQDAGDDDRGQCGQELTFLDAVDWLMSESDEPANDVDKAVIFLDPVRHDAGLNEVVVTSADVPSQSIHFADPAVQTQWHSIRHLVYIDSGSTTYGYRRDASSQADDTGKWTATACGRNPIGLHGGDLPSHHQRVVGLGNVDDGNNAKHLIRTDRLDQTIEKLGVVVSNHPHRNVRVEYRLICMKRRTIQIPANASNQLIEWSYMMEKLHKEGDDLVWFMPDSKMAWQNLVPSHHVNGFNIAYRDDDIQAVWGEIRERYVVERRFVKVVFSCSNTSSSNVWYVSRPLSDDCRIFEVSGRSIVPPAKKEVDVTRPYLLPTVDEWVKLKWPEVHREAERGVSEESIPNQTSYFDVLVIKRRPGDEEQS